MYCMALIFKVALALRLLVMLYLFEDVSVDIVTGTKDLLDL